MAFTEQQKKQAKQLLGVSIPTLSKPTIWLMRFILIVLFVAWVSGGVYLHLQVKRDQARIEQVRMEDERKDERLRRQASYQQELERYKKSSRPQSQLYGQ